MKNFFNSFMNFMSEKFAPAANKVLDNPWVAALGESWVKVVPFILVTSISSLLAAIKNFVPGFSWLPDLSWLINWTQDLIALMVVFVIPYLFFEKKGEKQYSLCAGMTGLVVFLIIINPVLEPTQFGSNWILDRGLLGGNGSHISTMVGIFVCFVYNLWLKFRIFDKLESLPDFVNGWFNNMIPIAFCIFVTRFMIVDCAFDFVSFANNLFAPLFSFGQSYLGFIFIVMIPCFFYTCGISIWAWAAAFAPILLNGIAENTAAVAAGGAALNIATKPTLYSLGLLSMGGTGCTLTLVILMVWKSRSKKLKNLGKVFLGPSIFNINEPLVYGAPIVFNPFLMVPMWINSFVVATLTYVIMKLGWLNIPSAPVQLGQLPAPFSTVITTNDIRGVFWYIVVFAISMVIWYPFFRAYDNECLEIELEKNIE